MKYSTNMVLVFLVIFILVISGCGSENEAPDGDTDNEGLPDGDADNSTDGDSTDDDSENIIDGDLTENDSESDNAVDGDDEIESAEEEMVTDGDMEEEEEVDYVVDNLLPPPGVPTELGYERPARQSGVDAPKQAEITAFTKKVTGFFKDTNYFDWVYRVSHGLDESYTVGSNENMMAYKLWWQDVGMRREGDTMTFFHRGRAENILKRSIKVMDGAIGGYLLTGDERMADVATQYLKGIVALSLGLEFEKEDPLVKYLQARAVFNHNHNYTVDDRKVYIDYTGSCVASFKWNVHVFEIADNPMYGNIWVSNMRSKDDVPYVFMSLPTVSRAYHQTKNQKLKEAAELYIEYMRGFSQSIVDNDWNILTKYEDGEAVIAYDATKETNPPADLGSFVHWRALYGEDAECNAQLGAALMGYADPWGKDCGDGMISWDLDGFSFEQMSGSVHFFNYNIYNYFHIGALASAEAWGRNHIAEPLMNGLIQRFDIMMNDEDLANRDHKEFNSDMAGWILSAAIHGYPLNAEEAKHIMQWYGESSDWYRTWEHWDPWATLPENTDYSDYKAPRDETVDDGNGGTYKKSYVRLVEMPYIFEYCASDVRDKEGIQFIDCDIVADPSQWGEDEK